MHIPGDLYDRILRSMPIPCVDLRVRDSGGRILLLRRSNAPAQGAWWFPGGRVHFGEPREAAVRRKLLEECGLEVGTLREVGTFDLLLDDGAAHSITTLFDVGVRPGEVRLDSQSLGFEWRAPDQWLAEPLHPFLRHALRAAP
jgi:ADP-ribose pyrophosphatase YjhB (NUDIX family)